MIADSWIEFLMISRRACHWMSIEWQVGKQIDDVANEAENPLFATTQIYPFKRQKVKKKSLCQAYTQYYTAEHKEVLHSTDTTSAHTANVTSDPCMEQTNTCHVLNNKQTKNERYYQRKNCAEFPIATLENWKKQCHIGKGVWKTWELDESIIIHWSKRAANSSASPYMDRLCGCVKCLDCGCLRKSSPGNWSIIGRPAITLENIGKLWTV